MRKVMLGATVAVALAAGLITVTLASRDTAEAAVADVDYSCTVGTGAAHKVRIRHTASLPRFAAVGEGLAPGSHAMKIVFPAAMAPELGQDTSVITGTIQLQLQAVLDPTPTKSISWKATSVTETTLGPSGDIRLAALVNTGRPVSPYIPAAEGVLEFRPDKLTMSLRPKVGPTVAVACVPTGTTPIAKVTIRKASAGTDFCPAPPTATAINPDLDVPSIPPSHTRTEAVPNPGCARLEGLSNLKKLDGAVRVSTFSSLKAIDVYRWAIKAGKTGFRQDHVAKTDPVQATGTFLTFGFFPTTTTVELAPIGLTNIYALDQVDASDRQDNLNIVVASKVKLTVIKASANGQDLPLGSNCTTTRPLDLILVGGERYDPPYDDDVLTGGVLRGTVEIPPFTGCGVGESLDRLLTASVSGKGNEIQVAQSSVCLLAAVSARCPPEVSINGPGAAKVKGVG